MGPLKGSHYTKEKSDNSWVRGNFDMFARVSALILRVGFDVKITRMHVKIKHVKSGQN